MTGEIDTPGPSGPQAGNSLTLSFDDNRLLALMFGEHDQHLTLIENRLGVDITPRGNQVALRGDVHARDNASHVLHTLYNRAAEGLEITPGDVDGAIRMAGQAEGDDSTAQIQTRRKLIQARSPGQKRYIRALGSHDLIFGVGPAGTGKTYLAVAAAAAALASGKADRLILSRPAVEAGERLGFLPGDMKEKVDPYLRPLYDALYDVLPASMVDRGLSDGTIEIAPLAFMRGRTLTSAFIILDEAQNTTPLQMKMFLTRFGEGSRMAVTGDPTQTDLPAGTVSGLQHAIRLLENVEGVAQIKFEVSDIVRHPLVTRIVAAYDRDAEQA
ncbi:MAG: PhoH family protein [Hyphomicrobiales bacterium]|nr:PhoH family protein [Hyphomicrobiales bacterium]